MIISNGTDNYGDRFDEFYWSAPYYETPAEVIQALQSMSFKNKPIKKINLIGAARSIDDSYPSLFYERLYNVGIELGMNWWLTYPGMENIKIPWEVEICEPVQIVFKDDSTLEFLPIGQGGARISENAIPVGQVDGLNRSNFNGDKYFNEIHGNFIKDISIKVKQSTEYCYDDYSIKKGFPTQNHMFTTYEYCFSLNSTNQFTLIHEGRSWYKVSIIKRTSPHELIPYGKFKKVYSKSNQIEITNGVNGGGCFHIYPMKKDSDYYDKSKFYYGISIDEDYVYEFLSEFIDYYFDSTIQDEYQDGMRIFDYNGYNRFSYESMQSMIKDINDIASILKRNPEVSEFKQITDKYYWGSPKDSNGNPLTEDEILELKRKRISTAIDFYERFTMRIGEMLKLSQFDTICFDGP